MKFPLLTLISVWIFSGSLQAVGTPPPSYNFTTIAGQPRVGASVGVIGPAGAFSGPTGICIDALGNLYITSTGNGTIRELDTNGVVSTIAGQPNIQGSADGNGTNATFYYPEGITSDGNGNLYVADTGNCTIRKIDSNGIVTTLAGQAGTRGIGDGIGTNALFNLPSGIVVDAFGNLFVTDSGNGTIRRIDTNGVVSTVAGQPGVQGGKDGSGTNATFGYPLGIEMDGSGNIFVTDFFGETVRKIDTNAVVTTIAGKSGIYGSSDGMGSKARFDAPYGIAMDQAGNLFVVDSQCLRKIDTNALVTTVAGKSISSGYADGTGSTARFNSPNGIAVDGTGNLYVSDTGNNIIREGSPTLNLSQFITFGAIPKQIYTNNPFDLTATASSGLAVTFSSSDPSVATVSSNTVTLTGAGKCTITATQVGNSAYRAASAHQILTVGKASQPISFDAIPTQSFGPTFLILTASSPSGTISFASSRPLVATVSGSTLAIVGAGLSTITATIPADANYSAATAHRVVTVAKSAQTISFTPTTSRPFVPGSQFSLVATAEGGTVSFKSSNPKVISIMGVVATIHATGTSTITAYQPGNGNYQAATPVAVGVTVQ